MSPPGSRALRPAVDVGTVLADRYRLRQRLPPVPGDPAEAHRWLAVDDVLSRPIDVLLLPAHDQWATRGRELLQAAADAGTVRSPVLVSVYDAALEEVPAERYGRPAGTMDAAYVVTEHVDAPTLADLLGGGGPLEPAVAVEQALAAGEALRAVHDRGFVHGALSPAALLVTPEGPRLRDTAVAAILARRSDPGREPGREPPEEAEADVRALAACVYAMLTGRWPGTATTAPAAGLGPAPLTPGREARLFSPRQVRAGVPRHLDDTVLRALEPRPGERGVRTTDQLLSALRAAADADFARAAVHRTGQLPTLPPQVRRYLPLGLSALLLVVVGVVGFGRGHDLGTVQQDSSRLEALVDSTPSPVPGGGGSEDDVGQRIDLTTPGLSVRAFDPPPGDGSENDAAVPNVVDGDAGTAWQTERYDTSRFGGLKPGVGLLVDLAEPTAVEQVELGLAPGTDVELRAANEVREDPAAWPLVASLAEAEEVARLVPDGPVTARFFLVWFTRLPPEEGRFRGAVRELFLVRP